MTLGTADYRCGTPECAGGRRHHCPRLQGQSLSLLRAATRGGTVFAIKLKLGRSLQRAWLITRYTDVIALLKDDANFVKKPHNAMTSEQLKKAPTANLPGPFKVLQQGLLSIDGADHDRLKRLVHKAFTPRTVEHMRAQTQAVTDKSLTRG